MAKSKMKWGDIKAALDGDDEDKKASAYAAIQAAFPDDKEDDDDEKKKEETKASDDEPEKKDSTDMKKCAEDEPEKKDAEEEPEKKDSTQASVIAAQDARIRALEAANATFQKERDDKERRDLLASREMSAELAKTLATKPLSVVRDICKALPAKTHKPISTEHVQATRGGTGGGDAPRLSPDASKALAERMGLRAGASAVHWDPNMRTSRVFPALAGIAAKKKEAV